MHVSLKNEYIIIIFQYIYMHFMENRFLVSNALQTRSSEHYHIHIRFSYKLYYWIRIEMLRQHNDS